MVADSEVIWAATNQGVMRYNRQTQEWRRYTIEDGLMDNQVNAIAMDGDVVWFGANSGLTAFRWRAPGRVD
jgi:ligand-binding sensor domain-containing protein